MGAAALCHGEAFLPQRVVMGAVEGDDDELFVRFGLWRRQRLGNGEGGKKAKGESKDLARHSGGISGESVKELFVPSLLQECGNPLIHLEIRDRYRYALVNK
ncbi:hypothetical protein [Sinorhizobium chiapasense]|uniref:Transposase n=1 Tax=Sinorhizobium chiapasense TaxID=501572 RepID=A0ABZ2B4Y8_9HYPH